MGFYTTTTPTLETQLQQSICQLLPPPTDVYTTKIMGDQLSPGVHEGQQIDIALMDSFKNYKDHQMYWIASEKINTIAYVHLVKKAIGLYFKIQYSTYTKPSTSILIPVADVIMMGMVVSVS